jgi:glycosyltransferase involved in cell wall biosynthesis
LPDDPPGVSVVIPSYNRRDLLAHVLEALGRQDYPNDLYEVIVVLDGSTDGSAEMVRSMVPPYRLQLLEQSNSGQGAARNRGARRASEPLLVFLDDDIIPAPELLTAHAAGNASSGSRHVGLGACPSALRDTRAWSLLRRSWWEDHFARKAEPDHPWTALDYSSGNSSVQREFFFSCGAFDERFKARNEEQELGFRYAENGASFGYHPNARGWHHFETDLRKGLEEHRGQAYYDVELVRKHPRLRSRVTIAAYARRNHLGMSSRAHFAYEHARALAALVPFALRVATACEFLRLRRCYHLLTGWLMAHAYLSGLRDAIPDQRRLLEFLRPFADEPPEAVFEVPLEDRAALDVPPQGGSLAVRVTHRGRTLAEVPAMTPGREWNWDDLTERAAEACLPEAKRILTVSELLALTGRETRVTT